MGELPISSRMKEQLIQGKEAAKELLVLLQKPSKKGELPVTAESLIDKVLKSFTEPLSVLSSDSCENDHQHLGSFCEDQRSEGSTESRKRAAVKDRRGCYKRRKNIEAKTVVSNTIEDGRPWRKYGQKEILNSTYPRAYFRCTRKYDQGCKAIKQVQKMEDHPHLYEITYIGGHTCKDVLKAPQIITDCEPWKSLLDSKIPSCEKQDWQILNSAVKEEEFKEDTVLTDLTDNTNNMSFTGSMSWPHHDLFPLESSELTLVPPNVGSMYSCTDVSCNGLNMDDLIASVDIDSDFQF